MMLPEKFAPHILNHYPDFDLTVKVKKAFAARNPLRIENDKDHIRLCKGLEGWVVKSERADRDFASDTHLYRVRKAHRIQDLITCFHFEDFAVVPKKYLYFHPPFRAWFVIAERLTVYKSEKITLTLNQARAVSQIILETCLTDLHEENVMLDERGRVAFIDTEPVIRGSIKEIRRKFVYRSYLLDISLVKLAFALTGTYRLKQCVLNESAKQEIGKVEWQYVNRAMIKTLVKVVVLSLGVFFFYSRVIRGVFIALITLKVLEATALLALKKF